jgi:tetratricopeptide (TPR) repeat protein
MLFIGTMAGLAQESGILIKPRLLFEERNFNEAKRLLAVVSKNSQEYPEAQYYLGRIAILQKDYEASAEYFENAIAIRPEVADYHNWLGVMYGVMAMDANPFKQAYLAPKIKNEFEKATAIDPRNIPAEWGLINYYTKAPGFLGGSWEKAVQCAGVISQVNAAQGLRALGFIHAAQKKIVLAEQELVSAIKLEPANAENAFELARFYEEQHKADQALALYERVLKKDPMNMMAAFHLGKLSASSGRYFEKGIVCLNQYLNYRPRPTEPDHAGANLNLAMIYEKKGDKSRAKNYYETSLRQEPGMKAAKEGLARVQL